MSAAREARRAEPEAGSATAAARPALIELEGATFAYRRKPVLEDVDLRLEAGCLCGIVGANGSGKTTLLRGLLGLVRPRRGRLRSHARRIGYVPQREQLDDLYPLRAIDVVEMGAFGRLNRWRRLSQDDRALAQSCLERVGLADRARAGFARLSGGQRQRVLLARALMVRPDLLLLDEPTSGVDERAADAIHSLLRELREREGVAIGLVSHQLASVRAEADHLVHVEGGRVRVEAITNPRPADGGRDAEPTRDLRARSPESLRAAPRVERCGEGERAGDGDDRERAREGPDKGDDGSDDARPGLSSGGGRG